MSVSNILDQNGVILSQFLPTAVTAPPVYGSFYFYNTTGNQTVAVGQGFNLPSTGSAVSPPAVSPSGAFVAGTPAETNLCTTTNSYYYTVAQPGVYSVSFTATVTPNSSTASTTNIVSIAVGSSLTTFQELEYTKTYVTLPPTTTSVGSFPLAATYIVTISAPNTLIELIQSTDPFSSKAPITVIDASLTLVKVA